MFRFSALPRPSLPIPTLPRPEAFARALPIRALSSARFIPFALQKKVLEEGMVRAFREPIEDGDFDFLQNHWLKVQISDIGLQWFISYDNGRLIVHRDEEADATIRGNLKEFMLLAARAEDPDTLFFQRRLMIEGDTEIGLEAKNLMDGIDQDGLPKEIKLILDRCANLAQRFL